MSAVIGALRAELSASIAQWQSDMGKAADSVKKLSSQFEKVGQQMQQVGGAMTIAITAPLVLFGKSSIQAASDAAEMQSAFKYTFGDMADSVKAWAQKTGDALGRSSVVMQQQALSFQQLFKSAAPTNTEAAALSKNFAVLAQDLASFYNVTEQDALDKLRAGLVGEAEPLRAFGVFLSAAAVETEALSMGLAKTAKGLTEQDKILARAALIMKATADAQGDAARTSDSFANKQKAAAAAVQDMQIAVGEVLLPVMTDLTGWITKAANAFSALDPEAQKWIVAAAGVAAVVGPLILILGSLSTAISAIISIAPLVGTALTVMTGPIGIAIAAVGALVAIWVLFGDEITAALQKAWQWVQSTFVKIRDAVTIQVAQVLVGLITGWQNARAAVIEAVAAMVKGVIDWFGSRLKAAVDGVKNLIGGVTKAFKDMYIAVVGNSYVPDMVDQIGQQMNRLDAVMVKPASKAAKATQEAFKDLLQATASLVQSLMTPQEQASLAFREDMRVLDQALKAKIITMKQYADLVERVKTKMAEAAGIDVDQIGKKFKEPGFVGIEKYTKKSEIHDLPDQELKTPGGGFIDEFYKSQEELRTVFSETFADGMRAALDGDFKGWFQNWWQTTLSNSMQRILEDLGGRIFDMLGGKGGTFGGILSSIFGQKSGGFGGGFGGGSSGGGFLSALFSGGFRAGGGPVNPGRSYVVGEFRPEVFKPSVSGVIEPGGAGTTQIFNIKTPDADSFRRSQRQIARSARGMVAGI